jgi:hypothetical protein
MFGQLQGGLTFAAKLEAGGRAAMATTRRRSMPTRDRLLYIEEDGAIWLLKRGGPELRGRIVTREQLRHEFPGLYADSSRRTGKIARGWSWNRRDNLRAFAGA